MSAKHPLRWGPVVFSALASLVFTICLLPTLLLATMTPWYRGETDYCTPPDHSGPSDRVQEMSTGGATFLVGAALVLAGAALVVLKYGWRRTLGERRVQGSLIVLAAMLASIMAYGLMTYGHSPA